MFEEIAVIGLGYVGLAQALLFNKDFDVVGYDIDNEKLKLLEAQISPIKDQEFTAFLKDKKLKTTNIFTASLAQKDLIIIATPTHFIDETKTFDLSSILMTLETLDRYNAQGVILIKSTLHIGATKMIRDKFPKLRIFNSPEFLREGSALFDNLHPHRIVVGYDLSVQKEYEIAENIAKLYSDKSLNAKDVPLFLTSHEEAEAIKLFANAYLALRVSFFNELDSYALSTNLNALTIIDAISADPRIGNYYNNPSFGYGGYCLPKDIKQLHANYAFIPEHLISGTIASNKERKLFIAEHILKIFKDREGKTVGIYRLTMKKGSDNFRHSSILDVVSFLKKEDVKMVIYEPLILEDEYDGIRVIKDLADFKKESDLIITNRRDALLDDVLNKVFTRDIKLRD